jgi:hypothetical protein
MTGDPNEISDRYGDQGWQKSAEEKDHRKIDQRHRTAYGTKTDKFEYSVSSQHGSIPSKVRI